jgi:hypothetical protein
MKIGDQNQRQQQIIQFQNAQIETLLKKLGKKRLLLDDDQRRLLAVKAHAIGRKALLEITPIFTLDTILRWHRELVEKKLDSSANKEARPATNSRGPRGYDCSPREGESDVGIRSNSGSTEEHWLPHRRLDGRQCAQCTRH